MARASRRQKKAVDASAKEAKIQEACAAYRAGSYTKMTDAAIAYVSYPTLRRRLEGITRPKHLAHEKQMLMSLTQESVLCEWLEYLGASGHPVSSDPLPRRSIHSAGLGRRNTGSRAS